jgi:hypothetical protein
MSGSISLGGTFGVNNAIIPRGGPKVVRAILDFSNVSEILIDGQQIVSQGQIEYLQGFYVDNADNNVSISFVMSATNQRIVVPANTQGYYSLLIPNDPKIVARMDQANNRVVECFFYNVPIQSQNWLTQ